MACVSVTGLYTDHVVGLNKIQEVFLCQKYPPRYGVPSFKVEMHVQS